MARKKTATGRRSGKGGGSRRSPTVYTGSSKRVIDYLAKHPHATVAQARGHKPAEHATRKERARAAGKLDENQRAAIKRFATKQASARRMGADPGDLYRQMVERFDRPGGYARFERARGGVGVNEKKRRRRNRVRRLDKSGRMVRLEMKAEPVWDDMEDFADDLDVPVEWLYYH